MSIAQRAILYVLFTLRYGRLIILRGAPGRQQSILLRIRPAGKLRCCTGVHTSTIWRSSMLRGSGDGYRPIPEAAQQRNLSSGPMGSRRRLAHQRRYRNRSKQGIVGGPINAPAIQGFLKGVRPLESAFGSFPTREKNAPPPRRQIRRTTLFSSAYSDRAASAGPAYQSG